MKIAIMTDLEGVAGVLDSENWCLWDSRYYEIAKELLTEEVNAAIRGFRSEGVSEMFVIDGHGYGGIDIQLLDSGVEYSRGWSGPWPFGIDETFDAVAWIGQHAKAGTEKAHIAHTGSMHVIDLSVNGVSIGEFGEIAFCAAELGVASIFGSGDEAFTKEALALIPSIETVAVKRGVTPGSGDEASTEEYHKRNVGAVHIPPARARNLIFDGAKRAVERFKNGEIETVHMDPPYESVAIYRPDDSQPRREYRKTHPTSFIAMLNS